MCAVQSAWARVAPTFPSDQAKTLVDGGTYYLYNPGSDRFVYRNSGSLYAYTGSYSALTITSIGDNLYNLLFDGSSYYLYSSGTSVGASTTYNSSYAEYRKFIIKSTDGGYTIQRNYNYDETNFVGNATGNSSINSNFTEGNIVWQLYDEDGVAAILRYRAKKALYDALVSAEDYQLSFAVEDFEALYANNNATNDELKAAATAINDALMWKDKLASGASEYPIYTQLTGDANWSGTSCTIKNGQGGLNVTVEVDQAATLVYLYSLNNNWSYYSFNVYLDGTLYQTIGNYEGYNDGGGSQRFFVELSPGRHTIDWVATSGSESTSTKFSLYGIGAYKTPTITVNLTQAGSLGTEVLYNVDHIKDVRKLVVKGNMNDDDWLRMNMMDNLFELDLTDANVESLPRVSPGSYFHKIKLPKVLKEIQSSALSSTLLDEIEFPDGLVSIGEAAFSQTRIREAVIPQTVSNVGERAFAYNESLKKVVWPTQVKAIPINCFLNDYAMTTIDIPEGVTTISDYAFKYNYSCKFELPSTIKWIGREAFEDADQIEVLNIPNNTTIGYRAFANCPKLKSVTIGEGVSFKDYYGYATFSNCTKLEEIVFPTSYSSIAYSGMLSGCTSLKKVTFKSPTMVNGAEYKSFFSGLGTDIQVYVPSYLVNTYKLDSYWYNYNIMGFSTADISSWNIQKALTFYSQDRFEGTPSIVISGGGSWTINGDQTQQIDDFTTYYSTSSSGLHSSSARVVSNCDNVQINGTYTHQYYAYNSNSSGSNKGRWHFISLPFDIKVSEITCSDDARFAIRYYDGANRALNGTGGNWKDYATDAVITAGTGFIVQASKDCTFYFKSLENASKQNAVSNKLFTKALDANPSEQASNKGWNLVGNPWQSYYNIHKLNFTAPITIYNGYSKTYSAKSVIDDDYAILPNQAFFVQCPDGVSSISFPVDGRQTTNVIESQNGARASEQGTNSRQLIDLELSSGELSDNTRVVFSEAASTAYETTCDASKFFEAGSDCPQVFTIEDNELLAINERPVDNGTVLVGVLLPADGTYTFSAPRYQTSHVLLYDRDTDIETDLATGSYTFSAFGGYDLTRFVLSTGGISVTNVNALRKAQDTGDQWYNLNGQRVQLPSKGLFIKDGKKFFVK